MSTYFEGTKGYIQEIEIIIIIPSSLHSQWLNNCRQIAGTYGAKILTPLGDDCAEIICKNTINKKIKIINYIHHCFCVGILGHNSQFDHILSWRRREKILVKLT
jgi:hypothetical protein